MNRIAALLAAKMKDPHFIVHGRDGNMHVVPLELVRKWITGKLPFEECDDWKPIVRQIIAEWAGAKIRGWHRDDGEPCSG